MKRKVYDLIARVIKNLDSSECKYKGILTLRFTLELKKENANFNPDKFKKACGLYEL